MGFFEVSDLPRMEDLVAHLHTGLPVHIVQTWLVYRVALALYNISPWHPLYRFPGPRLASMTFLPEFWYDFVRHGRYTWQIQQMREKYDLRLGVIYEGLRLSYGLSTRLPRIARTENLRYASADGRFNYVVPMGTPIGMSPAIMHHNEDIFPNSHAFLPER